MQTNPITTSRTREHSRLAAAALAAAALLLIAGCGQGDETVDVDVPDPGDGREAVEAPTPEDERRGYDKSADMPATGAAMSEADDSVEPLLVARAELEPTEGNEARGTVTFSRAAGAVVMDGELMGLPEGLHGLHIHEKGDCSAPDGTSAGGHFAPDGDPHGSPDSPPAQHHVGDLGNIEANDEGYALVNVVDAEMTLDDGPKSVLGRAVIVHAGADDFETQPTGAAGARLACGVITEVPRTDPPDAG
ncbi:superoxide dismutase family protein [Lentisalinibacter salinarum]|uniref:superoxide dismutase family protein n=1 Tax=Lentisalinibacter salinarum TaxID=2992239 RepID=UPI0038709D0B